MSYCRKDGKDTLIFVSKEDHDKPSTAPLTVDEESSEPGLILPNGDINWDCPCIGTAAVGPCGPEFRAAFTCFHYSESEFKGEECMEMFSAMAECYKKYPGVYGDHDEEGKDETDMLDSNGDSTGDHTDKVDSGKSDNSSKSDTSKNSEQSPS